MKTSILILLFIGLVAPIFSQTNAKTKGQPVAGVACKFDFKWPKCKTIPFKGTTDENGVCEIKDLEAMSTEAGVCSIEFGIKEKGIKGPATVYRCDDFSLENSDKSDKPMVMKQMQGNYEVTFEVSKVKVNEADLAKQRGMISTSRSNIKIMIKNLASDDKLK
jgi:hypothetical protein